MEPSIAPEQPTARRLIQLFRAFEARLLERLRTRGFKDVTPGHLNVLRHLDRDGLSVVALARDAGMTKQAVSKTIAALTTRGYVRTRPDPKDSRAKRVEYTPRGRRLMAQAVEEVVAVEAEWRKVLGPTAHTALRTALETLLRHHGA